MNLSCRLAEVLSIKGAEHTRAQKRTAATWLAKAPLLTGLRKRGQQQGREVALTASAAAIRHLPTSAWSTSDGRLVTRVVSTVRLTLQLGNLQPAFHRRTCCYDALRKVVQRLLPKFVRGRQPAGRQSQSVSPRQNTRLSKRTTMSMTEGLLLTSAKALELAGSHVHPGRKSAQQSQTGCGAGQWRPQKCPLRCWGCIQEQYLMLLW